MCEERYRLVNEYSAAARSLARAAAQLRGLYGEELTQTRIDYEAMHAKCNETKEELLRHETGHEGCYGPLSRRASASGAGS